MRDGPSISVVIPAYNRENSIETAIRSTLTQTLPPSEVVVVDDGSKDQTAARVEAYGDPRVRLVRQENGGISAARNTGIREARSTWIAFQDSDDEWLPKKLERQFEALAAAPDSVACYCGMLIVGTADASEPGAGRTEATYHPPSSLKLVSGRILPTLMRDNPISTQTLVSKRETLIRLGLFDTALKSLVDWDLAIRLASSGDIEFVDEPLAIQHFSQNSITRDTEKRVQSWIHMLEKYRALFEADRPAHLHHVRRIAGTLRKLGRHQEASKWYAEARKLDPMGANTALLWLMNKASIRR